MSTDQRTNSEDPSRPLLSLWWWAWIIAVLTTGALYLLSWVG